MGLETFLNIDDLVSTNPVDNTDTVASMGAHIRGLKSTLKTDFPNITGAVTPTQDELNLLGSQEGGFLLKGSATGAGTADAITADFTPDISLTNGVTVIVRAVGANTINNPTFNPDGLGVKTIVKNSNSALAIGDIAGASHELILKYNSTNDNWTLLNPASQASKFSNSSDGSPTISTTAFNVTGLGTATWDTIGPTASGADHIWTALDSVPTDADWVEIKVALYGQMSGATASTLYSALYYGRGFGGTAGVSASTLVGGLSVLTDASGNGYSRVVTGGIRIAADTARFELQESTNTFSTGEFVIYLTGYGYN